MRDRRRPLAYAFDDLVLALLVVFGVCALLFATCAGPAAAQERAVRDLGLALAKVCVNEAGFESPADCALIWQVVEGQRATARERLWWLTRHSQRVLGTRPCRRGNCGWTPHLTRSGRRPAGWPAGVGWVPARWERVLYFCDRLVIGDETARPCAETPTTWDGRRWRAANERRGFRVVDCEGTLNDGLVRRRTR